MIDSTNHRPHVHTSHEMSEWEMDITLKRHSRPNFFAVRYCTHCDGIQTERHDQEFMDSKLLKPCAGL